MKQRYRKVRREHWTGHSNDDFGDQLISYVRRKLIECCHQQVCFWHSSWCQPSFLPSFLTSFVRLKWASIGVTKVKNKMENEKGDFFKHGPAPASFLNGPMHATSFFIFVFSIPYTVKHVQYNFLPVTRF